MARFVEIPDFSIFRDGTWAAPEEWWLSGRCIYQSDIKDERGVPYEVVVPDATNTDLSSIPRVFRLLIPKNGRHRAAAVVHDHLCRTGAVARKIADKIFLEAMALLGVPRWRRYTMYTGVRIGAMWKWIRRK